MSKIVRAALVRVAAVPPPPRLTPMADWSDAVAEAVDVMINPIETDSYGRRSARSMPPLYADDWDAIEELHAERAALKFEEVRAEDLFNWLLPLSLVVRNPPSKEDVAAFCAALVPLLNEDMPRWVPNTATQRQAAREFKFFPAAADILGILDPIWQAARDQRFALFHLLQRKPKSPKPRPEYEKPYRRGDQWRLAGGAMC